MAPGELTQISLDEEYQKRTGVTPEHIAELRRWLATQPHLPSKYITDLDLILAFHSCGCSTGVTKQVLDLHYTLRTHFTSLFQDRCFDARMETAANILLWIPLPSKTKEGYAVFYTHFLDYDPKRFSLIDNYRYALAVLDLWQYKEGTWPGIIIVADFEGLSLGHIARMDIRYMQQFLYFLQEATLVNLKGIYFINSPSVIDKLLAMIKPFIKKEMMDVFKIFNSETENIKSILPQESLPKECGGSYKNLKECRDDVIAMLRAGESYLKNESLKRVTESLRPGKPRTIADISGGVEGSFTKLDID